jgi:acetyl esterase/lipase
MGVLSAMLVGATANATAQTALASSACPTIALHMPPPPPGAMPPGGPPRVPMARTIAPSDTSNSIVIHPDPSWQIECGKTTLTSSKDVVFSHPRLGAGSALPLEMDIMAPAAPGRRPAVVYIPGGGFVFASKENALDLRTYVAEKGFVVASIQYRTAMNGATYRDGLADVKSAIRFLRAHADQYGVDARHVAVWGESAGGYLAAMAGVTGNTKAFDVGENLDQSSAVQAVVDKFGSSDISRIAADFDFQDQAEFARPGPIGAYLRTSYSAAGAKTDPAANPISYVSRSDPPFLLMHGSQDRLISPSQTLILHDALLAAGGHSTRYVLAGANHGDLSFMGDLESGKPWSARQTMDVIVDFLKANLDSTRP